MSSFAVFKGENPATLAAKAPQPPQQAAAAPPSRKIAAQIPPPSVVAQQNSSTMGSLNMGSLNALSGPVPVFQSRELVSSSSSSSLAAAQDDDDHDEGLFALPISPRSPEIGQSPFSFAFTGSDLSGTSKGASAA